MIPDPAADVPTIRLMRWIIASAGIAAATIAVLVIAASG